MLHDSPPQLSQPRVLLLNCTCFSDASAWDFCSQSTPHPVLIHTYFGCSTPTSCWIIMIPNSNFCKENEPQKQKLDLNIFSINICQCHEIQQLNTFHAIQQKKIHPKSLNQIRVRCIQYSWTLNQFQPWSHKPLLCGKLEYII